MKQHLFTLNEIFPTKFIMKQLTIIYLLVIFAGCEKDPTLFIDRPVGAARVMLADAGLDMEFELPLSTPVKLNSSQSANYASIQWRKLSGPGCLPADSILYNDQDLLFWEPGNYSFELTVLNRSSFLKDTVNIVARKSSACGETPEIKMVANTEIKNLDVPYGATIFLTAGEQVVGNNPNGNHIYPPYNIAIYDIPSQKLTSLTLKNDAYYMAAANTNDAFYLAGGTLYDSNDYELTSNRVSIYDKKAALWSEAELSEARTGVTGISAGELVFFAGGINANVPSARVDIYNQLTKKWSTAMLNEARTSILAITDHQKVYFAGGIQNGTPSTKIDIYDIATGQWTVEELKNHYYHLKGFFTDGKIYFAGNLINNATVTSVVEITDLNGHHLGLSCLPAGISTYRQQYPLIADHFVAVPGFSLNNINPTINLFDKQTGKWKLLVPKTSSSFDFFNINGLITYNNKLYSLALNNYWDDYEPYLVSIDLK
jgi:hypothetical protein